MLALIGLQDACPHAERANVLHGGKDRIPDELRPVGYPLELGGDRRIYFERDDFLLFLHHIYEYYKVIQKVNGKLERSFF